MLGKKKQNLTSGPDRKWKHQSQRSASLLLAEVNKKGEVADKNNRGFHQLSGKMPRGSEIPEGIRSTAVDLHKAGKGYKFISKTLEIPPSTVRSIIVKWKRFNTVATLPRSGRPSKGNPRRKRKEKLDEVRI